MAHDGLMVSVSGIRGKIGEALTPGDRDPLRRRLRRLDRGARQVANGGRRPGQSRLGPDAPPGGAGGTANRSGARSSTSVSRRRPPASWRWSTITPAVA